jgi:hypothetical protein
LHLIRIGSEGSYSWFHEVGDKGAIGPRVISGRSRAFVLVYTSRSGKFLGFVRGGSVSNSRTCVASEDVGRVYRIVVTSHAM